MPTAKKLPSGSWRCLIYSHTETITKPDGSTKKVERYKSFTSKDKTMAGKREAERLAREWQDSRSVDDMTIADAVRLYIDAREGVLSPSSIRSYRSYAKHRLSAISALSVRRIDTIAMQTWLSNMRAVEGLSPKTVRCVYGLVNAAYKEITKKDLDLTLPAPVHPDLHTPIDAEITALLDHIRGTELECAVILSALCSLRRSEICPLEASDLDGDVLTINKNMVRTPTGEWITKTPKTYLSDRTVIVPQAVIDFFAGKTGRVFTCHPDALSHRFRRAVAYLQRHGLSAHFRFHDLRHYYASIAHALGVPDVYIMQQGGWKSDHVMKRVYRDALPDRVRAEAEKVTSHLDALR